MRSIYTLVLFTALAITPVMAQEFVNPIQIPPLISQDDYHLNVIDTMHNFNPNGTDSLNTLVNTFAFEDANNPGTTSILGPTIAWNYLHDLTPKVTNKISEVTTCHWHGAHVPQFADGGPHQRIQPGDTWAPFFKVLDKSATMWYHPHAMGLTYRHVQMGLSGMIYVEDPVDGMDDPNTTFWHDIFPNDYGVDDFPLIFQTKKFMRDDDGNIAIDTANGFSSDYTYMVNGIVDPVLTVPQGMVRLRMLNGDGKFSFNFTFHNADGSSFPAQMIATDAGYTQRSHQIDDILMSPGERTEWLLDLRGMPEGQTLYVRNNVSGMPGGPRDIIGNSSTTGGYATDRDLLKIVVGPTLGPLSAIIGFPINITPSEQPPLSDVTRERTKTFRRDLFDVNPRPLYNIDSTLMNMMVVNDVVKVDSTELWTIDNQTDRAHPWHIHDIHFWVTEIKDSFDVSLDRNDYPELFDGPKDNVLVRPGWKLSYIATFDDFGTEVRFDSSYMYHCHILPHEDNGMMGQFVVWNGIGQGWPTSVEEELTNIRMTVYPNPAREVLFLDGTSTRESELRFIDMNGRLIKALRLPAFDGAIELSADGLPPGMLIMDWQTHEGRGVSKVMINR